LPSGKKPGEDHRFDGFKSGQRRRWPRGFRDGVAHARIRHALNVRDDEAHVASAKFVKRDGLGSECAERFDFVDFVAVAEADFRMFGDAAFHHAHQDHGAAINVEPGVEDERLQRIFRAAFRRRDALHDGFENVFDTEPTFCADEQSIRCGDSEYALNLLFDEIGLRGGQINFVDDRYDC
jgi:hypothetical protein